MERHKIKTMKLAELRPAEYNPRTISKEALSGLKASVKRFGLVQPIVWNERSKRIVGGHQRVMALLANGEKEADVVVVDLPAAEEKALNVALNNPHIAGDFTDNLQKLLDELAQSIPETVFDELRLDELINPKEDPNANLDEVPPTSSGKPTAKAGDLWLCGHHRLLCGDATKKENAARLFGNDQAHCVFTDPPYGVSYEPRSGKFKAIRNDDLRDDALLKLLAPSLTLAAHYAEDRAAFYIWHASSTREDFEAAIRAAGLIERQYIIWAKNGFSMGYADYRWSHEPCFYASKAERKPAFYGGMADSTVWRVSASAAGEITTTVGPGILITDGAGNRLYIQGAPPKNKKLRAARIAAGQKLWLSGADPQGTVWEVSREIDMEHPTQKPAELAIRAITNSTKDGEIVYDPFLGSGTTLIGAQATGRRCYGMELDPKYVDVIVKRWERLTGEKAKRA